MENSPDQLTPPDQPRVRRRLVQSILFPRKPSPDHGGERDAEEGEECSGSQKKKRERKPKACSKKVAVKSQETLNGRIDDKESSAKPNLLADPPQAKEQCIGSQEENNRASSPLESTPDMKSPQKSKRHASSTPKKKQLQTTPRKKNKNGNLKYACPEQMFDGSAKSEIAIQVPDLRLEAKMKAEENARLFSGRKLHPFFSSCKTSKKNQEMIDLDSWCPSEKKNSPNLGPIHVFEKVQDDTKPIDWGNYSFSTGKNYNRQCECSPFSGKSVDSLRFDDFADEPVIDCELITDVAMSREDSGMEKNHFVCGNPDNLRNSDAEWENRFLQERMTTYYEGTDRHPENSLWTNKFFPEKAIEVCGNSESVNFLSEWLRLWYEKGFCSSKDITVGEKSPLKGDNYNCCGSDCDSENKDVANGLKNVLLVTGPVGSGKSAAIYACAKEQGFHVIEVNASDWRTRALVMHRFEGGMESYWVQRTVETPVDSESKCFPTSFSTMFGAKVIQGSDQEITEVITLSDEEDFNGTPGKFICESNNVASDRSGNKPLILFEDVDAVLSEDHGLIATIQKLSENAKRPIIITSNSSNLVLPNNMDRHEISFTKPSMKELFSHAKMVCAAEKVNIQPRLVERFIGCCQGDIRKTILNLQFWCQGRKHRKDRKGRRKYGPLFYDIDAGHQMLPNILPWGHPSELSIMVEKEISQSLLAEESSKLKEIEENEKSENEIHDPPNWRTPDNGSIKAKKESILRRHFTAPNNNVFSSPEISAESPVAFTRRIVRRKLDTVLSSDSEGEEGMKNKIPISGTNLFGINSDEDVLFQVDNAPSAYNAAQLEISQKEISTEISNPLPEPLLNGTSEGLLNDTIQLFGANLLENKNNNEILFERDTNVPICYAETIMCSPPPSNCTASLMCSSPLSKQIVISNEDVTEKSFNSLFELPLEEKCEGGLNDKILTFGDNILENDNNDEILFQVDSSAPLMDSTPLSKQLVISMENVTEKCFNSLSEPTLKEKCEGGLNGKIITSGDNILENNNSDEILFQVDSSAPSYCAASLMCSTPLSKQLLISKENVIEESFNSLFEPPLEEKREGGLNDKIIASGDNFLKKNNNDEIFFEVDSSAPPYCAASLMCSIPIPKQLIISKEDDEKSSNSLSEPPLKGTCERGLIDIFLSSGDNILENNYNNEILFQVDSSAPSYCAATEVCSGLAPSQLVNSKEEMSEESFNPLSDPLFNGNCKSINMSCAPELSFVPETEINSGIFSTENELIKPVDSTYRSASNLEKSPQIVKFFGVDIVTPQVKEEDSIFGKKGEDSDNEQIEAGNSGYQVMDECSRMEFNKKANFEDEPQAPILSESVEETWMRIRNFDSDLRRYFTPEERDASVVMKLAYKMSNLISEADILLGDCQPLLCDTLEPSMIPSEKSHSLSWHDDHISMASTIAQHGICLFTNEITAVKPDKSSLNTTDLAWEMLASSSSSMAIGNLISQEREVEFSEMATPKSVISLKSDSDPNIFSMIQSIVPARSYLATRGESLYEYVSALGHISRSETSRLSQNSDKTRLRRVRVARNYLSTGGMMLSPDDITLLGQYSSYKKDL